MNEHRSEIALSVFLHENINETALRVFLHENVLSGSLHENANEIALNVFLHENVNEIQPQRYMMKPVKSRFGVTKASLNIAMKSRFGVTRVSSKIKKTMSKTSVR